MSEDRMKSVASLFFHMMKVIEASSGIHVEGCRVVLGDFDLVLDNEEDEVTICEAKKTFNVERL